MKILMNNTNLDKEIINTFFKEENVKKYIYKKSKSDKLIFPWDTKAPIVYKFEDIYIKVHGLKHRYHYFTKKARAVIVNKFHILLNSNNIRTIKPNIIAVNKKYSLVGTPDIHKNGFKLLSEINLEKQIEILDEIFNDLYNLKLYHYDNKPSNAVVDGDSIYYLLDIDSIRKPTLFRYPEWKLKKRSKVRHLKLLKKLKIKLKESKITKIS